MFEIDSISDISLMHRKLSDGQKQAAPWLSSSHHHVFVRETP